jgi:hypothetical protein
MGFEEIPDHLRSRYDILRWPAVANTYDSIIIIKRIATTRPGIPGKGACGTAPIRIDNYKTVLIGNLIESTGLLDQGRILRWIYSGLTRTTFPRVILARWEEDNSNTALGVPAAAHKLVYCIKSSSIYVSNGCE